VTWRRRIAVVVLMYLAALPLSGTICAMTCLPGASTVAAHHQDGQDCSASSETTAAARIGGLTGSDCGNHDGVLPQVAATVAQRADDLAVTSASATSDPAHPLFGSLTSFDLLHRYHPPPGTVPPTTTPLVLRV
jgi:hypothetical protein